MDNETTGIVEQDEDLTEVVESTDVEDEAFETAGFEDTEVVQEVIVSSGNDYTAVLEDINVKLTFIVVVFVLALAWFCWKKLVQYLDMFFK